MALLSGVVTYPDCAVSEKASWLSMVHTMPSVSGSAVAESIPTARAVPDMSTTVLTKTATRAGRVLGSLITVSPPAVARRLLCVRAGRAAPDLGQHPAVATAATVV